ncbi:MAG: leucine-rich repeat protein, partial [Kiritimatiellae bacterium]|nr:leucine-rich repeat protein [Kiritimatiellia bacterium]
MRRMLLIFLMIGLMRSAFPDQQTVASWDTGGYYTIEYYQYGGERVGNYVEFYGCSIVLVQQASGVVIIPESFTYKDSWSPCPDRYHITKIGNNAFNEDPARSHHNSIKSITLPDEIQSIGETAFANCRGLTNVTLGSGLATIGKWSFTNCTSLTSLILPASVSAIGSEAFLGCGKLKDVRLLGDAPTGLADSCVLDKARNVRYRRKYASSYSDSVRQEQFGGYLLFDDNEFLNIVGQVFSYGDTSWSGDYDVSHDGEGAMRSGGVGNNGESWIETTVNGPVRLSFWWKASSEEYDGEVFDYAYLSLDGEPQGTLTDYQLQGVAIGGKTGWTNVVFDITEPGEHTVRWTYKKDDVDESDVGEDCVWLDEISLDPLATLTFSLNGGEGTAPAPVNAFTRTTVFLPTAAGFDKAKYTFMGWNDGTNTYPAGTRYAVTATNVEFTAVWRANTLAAPMIASDDVADGGILDAKSATIAMSAEPGARIHYTLDGSTPTAASALYTGEFVADGLSVNVRAIAVRNNYFDSPVAEFSFTRKPSGAAECLNAEWRNVTTDVESPWTEVAGESAHDGVAALKSGTIGDGESSSVEMTVVGAGQIGFWWKTSSEISRNRKYDYVSFLVDG